MSRKPGKYGNRGNKPVSHGRAMFGKPLLTAPTNVNLSNGGPHTMFPTTCCPVCQLEVRIVRKGTVLGSHRVGKNRKQSWPCPGSDQPVT